MTIMAGVEHFMCAVISDIKAMKHLDLIGSPEVQLRVRIKYSLINHLINNQINELLNKLFNSVGLINQ